MSKRLNVLIKQCDQCPYYEHLWCWANMRDLEEEDEPIPSWCPLPDDVPPPVIEIDKWCEGSLDIYPVKEPEQPFPVGTVVKIDDWLNEKESLLVRSSWEIINYAPGMIFLETTGNSFYPTGYTRNYGISKFLDLNPKVVEQPE